MSVLTRKRRRSEAFQDDEEQQHEEQVEAEDQSEAEAQDDDAGSVAEKGDAPDERAKKEREVWDAFREEQYEVLEQLPLSLHRSFALMLELDQQVQDNEKKLVPTLREYISVRKTLASQSTAQDQNTAAAHASDEPAPMQEDQTSAQEALPENAQQQDTAPITRPQDSSSGPSSRQLLTKVANLSEEIVRASNEKVNVARFAYDLVDRYIRDLDRAIKEQETSLSLGLRPGTHPASIILPEVIPPTTTRTRIAQQPPPPPPEPIVAPEVPPVPRAVSEATSVNIQAEEDDEEEDEPTLGIESTESPERNGSRSILVRPRRRRTAKWSRKKKAVTPADTDQAETSTPEGTASLKLTVPPLSFITAQVGNKPGVAGDASELGALGDMPIDPNEPCYCYCNQVSFGVMVACDNDSCKREWFHLGCVGLKEPPPPKAKWYCRDCAEQMGKKKKGR
ncbi:hypothetical protein EVJ58_g1223 [Rhodofomes roseus]|uniref:Chromatin modification-related protein n=1 Tax=Rhodofomes roseus TaxID=34475 RepID=A0A4Y9YZR0_9APHY|nr:hypothetical protein EVJ58_g1223 [Rhodofomes roseus]